MSTPLKVACARYMREFCFCFPGPFVDERVFLALLLSVVTDINLPAIWCVRRQKQSKKKRRSLRREMHRFMCKSVTRPCRFWKQRWDWQVRIARAPTLESLQHRTLRSPTSYCQPFDLLSTKCLLFWALGRPCVHRQ